MIELMKQLCALPGPSGCEDAVREFVLEKVKPFADEMKTDAIGNIMVFRKGKKALERPVVLCAHMDEVGVIIKKITDDGMLKFGFVGGVDPRVVIGRPVRFGDVQGVIGIKAVHLTTAAERRTMPKTKDLYIDIGAASKAAAEDKVSLGDYGVFDSAVVEFGDGLIKAKAIDDRVGCATLLKLIEDEPPIDTWFCFTVQEEVGLRGAASMAYALDPGFAMVLEGTTAADLAEVEGGKAVCRGIASGLRRCRALLRRDRCDQLPAGRHCGADYGQNRRKRRGSRHHCRRNRRRDLRPGHQNAEARRPHRQCKLSGQRRERPDPPG